MKRNIKEEKEKELIRLKKEREELFWSIHNQKLVPLDKPVHHGWDGHWILRDDISRSPEATRLQHIIDTYGRSVWCRKKDFKVRNRKTNKLDDVNPYFRNISEYEYEDLSEKLKKYFVLDTTNKYGNMWWKPTYKVYIDSWKLVLKVKRSYKTHYREHDELLYQMYDEVDSKMYNLTPFPWSGYSSAKWWRRDERRKAKTKHRSENRTIINSYNGGDDLENMDVYSSYKTTSMHWY